MAKIVNVLLVSKIIPLDNFSKQNYKSIEYVIYFVQYVIYKCYNHFGHLSDKSNDIFDNKMKLTNFHFQLII